MAVAQWMKCEAGELKGPSLIPGQGEFISLKFLLRGYEPNGEQEEQEQQLKSFLGLWPMAADKNHFDEAGIEPSSSSAASAASCITPLPHRRLVCMMLEQPSELFTTVSYKCYE